MQKPPEGNLSLVYDIHLSIWTLFVQIAFMEELYRVKTGIMVAITDQFLTINYGTYFEPALMWCEFDKGTIISDGL